MSSTAISTASAEDPAIAPLICRVCGNSRRLEDYRVFRSGGERLVYFDFCIECEKRESTIVLYRRYATYATPEVLEAVYKAERTPEVRRTPDQQRYLVQARKVKEAVTPPEMATKELAERELARRRLIYFVQRFMPEYKAGWVHQDICRRLEKFMHQVERGESPRLMLFMPPRGGKSKLASDMAISWMLGHHPEWEFISAAYAQSLPIGFSRSIRDRLNDMEYQNIFERTKLRRDTQAIDEWKTTAGGGYVAAGIGVGIGGKGFNVGIVDDPVKDQEAAQSETIRAATLGWYQSTFRTRVAPGGGILIIQTRWHDADLSGALLEEEEKLRAAGTPEHELENWTVVSYPAIAEHDEVLLADGRIVHGKPKEEDNVIRVLRRRGEALHPERYSVNDFKKLRNVLAPSIWNALYQQNPAPDDGEFFKRSDFVYRQLDPARWSMGVMLTTADYAFKLAARNDYSVITTGVLMSDGCLYVLDVRRGRWTSLEMARELLLVFARYKTTVFGGEQGATHSAIWPIVEQLMAAHNPPVYVSVDQTLQPIQDKPLRARPLQAFSQAHKLVFSYDTLTKPLLWDAMEREMLRFPTGAHDDIVDALAWLVRLAMTTTVPEYGNTSPPRPSWRDELVVETATSDSFMAG